MSADETPRKRPTVAEVRRLELAASEAIRARREAETHAENAQRNLDAAIAARDAAEAIDPEAKALAKCVSAIESMLADEEAARRQRSSSYDFATVRYHDHQQPAALTMPVGRILLSLAARYAVPLDPSPPQSQDRAGQRLISVPAHVADQIERMPMEAWNL